MLEAEVVERGAIVDDDLYNFILVLVAIVGALADGDILKVLIVRLRRC